MKFIRFISFCLFLVLSCKSYAHENKYVFVGQNEGNGQAKTAFILELMGDDLENHVQISESGEVYLKVDNIIAVPKETFSNFASHGNAQGLYEFEEDLTQCGSRVVKPPKWQCPYCRLWWEMGEKCTNGNCPKNQWKKNKK
jgi:hypothetical protein